MTEEQKLTSKETVEIGQEAMAGWEKAKREAMKKELDNALQQKAVSEERMSHLDAALKECMQQLHFVREDQEKRIHSAVIMAAEEFDKKRIALNEKLAEAGKRIARLEAENSQLHKALSSKEKAIQELSKYTTQREADLNALALRLESTEKEKASLTYEVRVLEKELDIRNEETEFNRRAADIAQKQQQESVKRIAKLEAECLRLRHLVRRRLPGPAALTRMKNEVEMLGKDQVGTRRRRSNPSVISSVEFHVDDAADTPSKRINFLTDQLLRMEEQNRNLHCALNNKSSQSQFPRNTYARAASRPSQGDAQVEGSFKKEHSLAALSDVGSDDKASCAESWASALISELEHFKNEKQSNGYMGTPEMNLMDDFAEMEKLAIVTIDYPAATSSHHSSEEGNAVIGPSEGHSSPTTGGEMVPVHSFESETLISGQEIQSESENTAANRSSRRLDELLKMLLEYCQVLKISPHEVLDDMKVALEHNTSESMHLNGKGTPKVSRQVSNKSFNVEATETGNANDISTTMKSDQKLECDVSIPICKILELLEGIDILPQENGAAASFLGEDDKLSPHKSLATPTGYMVRVFQWKSAELSEILQQFLQTCNDLLNGKANLEQFVQLVASSLDWIMNHCFSLQDVSSMKDAMRSRLEWDESRSESEFDSGSANHSAESNRLSIQREEEAKKLIVEPANTELSTIDFGRRAQSQIAKAENQPEKETTVQSIGNTGDQIKNWKMMQEDLETQFMEAYHEQRNACRNISPPPKNDLENTSKSFERQEETCNDQDTQQRSKKSNRGQDDGNPCEMQLRDDWEITAASEKLAECQETILNLGKQLKALASPRDAAIFDAVISTPADYVITSTAPKRIVSKRLSLRDNMLAEDSDHIGATPITTDDIQNGNSNSTVSTNPALESWCKFNDPDGIKGEADTNAIVSMAIVPRKKKEGRSFLKKLFLWQKKGDRKKTLFS